MGIDKLVCKEARLREAPLGYKLNNSDKKGIKV